MASLIHNRYASTKFDWIINDFSKVNSDDGLFSDVFSLGGFEWQVQIYPKGYGKVFDHLSIYLTPVDYNNYPTAEFSAYVLNLYDHDGSAREDSVGFEQKFDKDGNYGWGTSTFMPLSELHDPEEGYIVHGTCVIRIQVSCRMMDDFVSECEKESNPEKIIQLPGAGQPFAKGQVNNKVSFGVDNQEFEDIGGFHVLKEQAKLYKQIWLKYGHIPSTNVMPIASYQALVMVVRDLLGFITDMNKCHYVDLESEKIERWEDMITMAEKLEFNIGWLRERFEDVKKEMCGMQNVKTELLELGEGLSTTRSKIKVLKNLVRKSEVQLISKKDDMREKLSGLLSESDIETYLKIGEDTLLDGLLDDAGETVDESNPETVMQSVEGENVQSVEGESNSDVEGDNDSEVGFVEVEEDLEDIEGFHMLNLSD